MLRIAFFLSLLAFPLQSLAQIQVVTSFSILGDLAHQIGGDKVNITNIVGPDQDAHVYSPTVGDARAVAGADLIIFNGLGFETWSTNLVAASGTDAPIITVTDWLTSIGHSQGDEDKDHKAHDHDEDGHDENEPHDEAEHSEHDDEGEKGHAPEFHAHDHGMADPHAWGALANGLVYAQTIRDALIDLDPANTVYYQDRFETFASELEQTKQAFAGRIAALPADHRTLVTTHDSFDYLAEETGLVFLAAKGIHSGSSATASQLRDLILQLRELPHAALFVENLTSPALIEQIAKETGLAVGGRLYSDALSGPEGPAPTYLDMYRHNMETILSALEAH